MVAVEIEGLSWLVNAPKVVRTVIDGAGLPAGMTCPDPRAFALHELRLSRRPDRSAIKALRDASQAAMVAELVRTRSTAGFEDDAALAALPRLLREHRAELSTGAPPAIDTDW